MRHLHRGRRTHGASASVPNLHQLDGRNLARPFPEAAGPSHASRFARFLSCGSTRDKDDIPRIQRCRGLVALPRNRCLGPQLPIPSVCLPRLSPDDSGVWRNCAPRQWRRGTRDTSQRDIEVPVAHNFCLTCTDSVCTISPKTSESLSKRTRSSV